MGRFRTLVGLVGLAAIGLWSGAMPAQAAVGRVVVIVMENKPYSKIVGSAQAPYINSLIAQGKLFTNYSAITNGSLRDYLAMTSGLTSNTSPPSPNVFQAIDATGGAETWTSFQESMGGNCGVKSSATVPGTSVALYTRQHDPAYQYRANETCATHDIPMTTATFNPATLPTFSLIVPNQCDDMHTLPTNGQTCPAYFGPNAGSTTTKMGDNWLQAVVPQILLQNDETVVLVWDEGAKTTQHVVALEVGAGVSPATTDSAAYNHYGLEAGLYATLGLGPAPNNGATATPLPIP